MDTPDFAQYTIGIAAISMLSHRVDLDAAVLGRAMKSTTMKQGRDRHLCHPRPLHLDDQVL
jgi:hypothetical protein